MPLNINLLQVLLHMLNFLILAGGLTFLLYRPVVKILNQRRDDIAAAALRQQQDAEENERLRREYEEKLSAVDAEIRSMKKAAEKETAEQADQYIRDARSKADAILAKAERDAEEQRDHILESAQTEIGELVLASVQKLLSDTVTPERNSALYDEFIRMTDAEIAEKRAAEHGRE